jgi:hypothetical protein
MKITRLFSIDSKDVGGEWSWEEKGKNKISVDICSKEETGTKPDSLSHGKSSTS